MTVFIVLGLFNLSNYVYTAYNKEKVENPTDLTALPLQPIETKEEVSNNIILEEKEAEKLEPLPKDPKIDAALNVISNYYINGISKNIKTHFSSNANNMCSIVYKISSSELIIASCDDYTFKRQVELALEKVKMYPSKTVNGIDLSKEIVYFDYLTKENALSSK